LKRELESQKKQHNLSMVGYQLSARQLSQEKHFMVKARAIDREFELARML
jgi:hypothetical protein